ncbi:MAG TPA: PLP-dependent aminotransferase family protein [Bacillota bacterium]|nr:PLP-dependent aminotransferase family protein [Bacillota bacterium]
MDWKPQRDSDIPIYLQIADYIEQRILYGEYTPGQVLHSERSLAKLFDVNRGTIIQAYEVLYSKGLVEKIKGSGTRVSHDIWGLSRNRVPNWNLYIESGSFLPNLPIYQHIRNEIQERSLINFASGELSRELMPYDEMQSILGHKSFNHSLGYEHPQGNLGLREVLVEHFKNFRGIHCTSGSILITSGAQQALHLIVQCLLNPGDSVAIEDPSYAYSLPIFRSANIKTHLLPVGEHGINPEDIINLYKKHRIKMIFLNPIFQNPTGTVLSLEKRKKILEISSELAIPIVEDDPYSLLSYDDKIDTQTLKSLDTNKTVLYISSLSKSVASGLRIGWIVGPDRIIDRLADAKQLIDFGHSSIPQWIASEFLRSELFSDHLKKVKQSLVEKRDLTIEALENELSNLVTFSIPQGGIHLWCRLKKNIKEYHLLEESLRNGVAFTPGSLFGSEKGFLRLTFGRVETDLISEGIVRLKKSIQKLC